MASAASARKGSSRPSPLRPTRSFPRTEPRDSSPASGSGSTRSQRASTIPNGIPPQQSPVSPLPPVRHAQADGDAPDAFETATADSAANDDGVEPSRPSVDLDDIPIELISLIDSFIDSLSAKVHDLPPTIDTVARLFQDFYALAASHINTHIASLALRQQRESSPAEPASGRTSAASLLRAKAASLGTKEKPKPPLARVDSDQMMLTAEELADRKRARKALEHKRANLEEAVERRLCEGTYDRIYRHRSTQDEAQDDKLRSKAAALAVVGIDPSDLGVDLGLDPSRGPDAVAERVDEVRAWLGPARQEIGRMRGRRYPYGKLSHLKAAHKSIVDTLAHFHPSASADEIMPMLIYTLISMPPEDGCSVISDMRFMQRFRWEEKLVGEAAYCLTNLEAAISFLETVDLSTLRADEAPSGPPKAPTGEAGASKMETFPPIFPSGVSAAPQTAVETTAKGAAVISKPLPSPTGLRAAMQVKNRRLSDLVNTPAQALNAASDAVFSTADHGLKTIGNSLGDSYKFLIGKLRERDSTAGPSGDLVVPKTLDDARKLIGTPPPDDDGSASGGSSIHNLEKPEPGQRPAGKEEKVLSLIGGRKASRDHSADSSRSAGSSSKRVLFAEDARERSLVVSPNPPLALGTPPIMESVRNLGNTLNPMNRIAGFGGFRGFGRTTPGPGTPPASAAAGKGVAEGGDLATAFPDIAGALPPKEATRIAPPVRRFMEMQNPADLRIGEVLELLRDYRRLAGALKDLGAFKEPS